MSNLKITLNAETTFEFELAVKGIEVGSADVRFGLEKSGVIFQFKCSKKAGAWSVNVPALDSYGLKEGLYKYTIEVIANGYYFAPVKGTAEVAPAAEVTGNMVTKDVKVSVSGIKVTESRVFAKKKKKPVVRASHRPLTEREDKVLKKQNKFNSSFSKSRLRQLAGID